MSVHKTTLTGLFETVTGALRDPESGFLRPCLGLFETLSSNEGVFGGKE